MTRVDQAPTQWDDSSETGSEMRSRGPKSRGDVCTCAERCNTCGKKKDGDEKDGKKENFKHNTYATKKSLLSGLLDISLVVANATQLKAVIDLGPDGTSYYWYLMVLICLSLLLQVVTGIFLLTLGVLKLDRKGKNPKCSRYNNITVALTTAIMIDNLVIGAFRVP